ncbi:MAG: hypothetical protein R3211_03645 [Balneolaceae bacterium]|nr:hypothetical protein [Balneolaceae bacterium]
MGLFGAGIFVMPDIVVGTAGGYAWAKEGMSGPDAFPAEWSS